MSGYEVVFPHEEL